MLRGFFFSFSLLNCTVLMCAFSFISIGSDLEEEDSDEEDDDDEDSEADLSEIRIVPEDKNMCKFDLQLLSQCSNTWNFVGRSVPWMFFASVL